MLSVPFCCNSQKSVPRPPSLGTKTAKDTMFPPPNKYM